MADTELAVGMHQFMTTAKGFHATVKARYSDFIVREISKNGHVCYLKSMEYNESKVEDVAEVSSVNQPPPPASESEIIQIFSTMIGADNATKLMEYAQQDRKDTSGPLRVSGEFLDEKQIRRLIHERIRECFGSKLDSLVITLQDGSRELIVNPSSQPFQGLDKETQKQFAGFKRKRNDGSGGGASSTKREDYRNKIISFVLCKKNLDVNEAISKMSYILHINSKEFSFAGTKDKRAITLQRMMLRGINPDRLAKYNSHSRELKTGDYVVIDKKDAEGIYPMKLGDLQGNRFSIVLRDLDPSEISREELLERVHSLESQGFINYFGLQRFGVGSHRTHEIGFELFQSRYEQVIRMVLAPYDPNFGKKEDNVVELYEERKEHIRLMQEFLEHKITATKVLDASRGSNVKLSYLERQILSAYRKLEEANLPCSNHATAFQCIPQNLRKMYLHAVQSYLWNRMASCRMESGRSRQYAEAGDLILIDEETSIQTQANSCSPTNHNPLESDRTDMDEQGDGCDLSVDAKIHIVTDEEASQYAYTIQNVVLPLIGTKTLLPTGPVGQLAHELLCHHQIDFNNASISNLCRTYGLVGGYRRLIGFPKDIQADFYLYCNDRDDLIPSELSTTSPGVLKWDPSTHHFGSIYPSSDSPTALPTPTKHAMCLTFTLDIAQYATMVVRELTHRCSDYKS